MTRRMRVILLLLTVVAPATGRAADGQTLLLRQPTLSDNQLVFVYAGDLWIASRDGSDPRRLTSDPADERRPHFSPDGTHVAYTAAYGGNTDVYVIPAEGGSATRLTFHPGNDEVSGWSADGKRIAFSSAREVGNGRSGQLYEVPLEGGFPKKVMEAPFFSGAWNGSRIAYMPFGPAYNGLFGGSSGWKGYRGGTTPYINILDPRAGDLTRVPGDGVNDISPMWDGNTLYFLSDRDNKTFNVHAYDRAGGSVRRITGETAWDVLSADVHDGTLVYEAGGHLKTMDLAGGTARDLPIELHADLPQARPQWKDATGNIETVGISPTGKRAVITARGDVFTVPTRYGSTRNLTATDAVREYTAMWSPDGSRIAYVEDRDGKQSLVVADQEGAGKPRRMQLGEDFNALLAWGGDGRYIAYQDNHLTLHVMDLDSGRSRKVATHDVRAQFGVTVSPDGRWLAFTLTHHNRFGDLMLYDTTSGDAVRISDGMADVSEAAFSPDGQYLYFAASTNSGPIQVGLDLSSQERPRRLALYAVVLATDGESPLAPRTGDENAKDDEPDEGDGKTAEGKDSAKNDEPKITPTRIDLEGLADRVVALPVAERNYADLSVDKDGDVWFVDQVQPGASVVPGDATVESGNSLKRFVMEDREIEQVADGITALVMSQDGEHLLARDAEGKWQSAEIKDEVKLEALDTADMRMRIDPRVEWAQIFRDAWRMEQAFFYADNMHGLDWKAVYDRYRPLLDHAGRREDVNDLMVQMIAEMQVGHNRVGGGDVYEPTGEAPAGLLGADLRLDGGRYRIERIYDGERWNPFLQAPLARPELGVHEGDYILAVNGRELTADANIFQYLQGTVGKQTRLRVSSSRSGDGRTVVVEPTANERELRLWDWVERKRQQVDEATDGRVGYVYLPDTAGGGFTFFNRMFFAQADRKALIVDERSNGGGQAANYVTDVLGRSYLASWRDREGQGFDTPGGAVYGPKVMLIDQDAGSGGDFLPYAFRHEKLGKLIGTRTWGGLIGIAANPPLVDGGNLLVPFFRFYTPEGNWAIENEGVTPDIDVPLDPVAFNRGDDVQLQRAISEVLAELDDYQPIHRQEPPPLPTQLGE